MNTLLMILEFFYSATLLGLFVYKATDLYEYINENGGFKVAPSHTIMRFVFWVVLYFCWFIL